MTYCIEPLAPRETDFVNTVADAAAIVQRIGNPALRTMIDTSAAAMAEPEPVAAADRALDADGAPRPCPAQRSQPPRARRRATTRFAPVLAALQRTGYDGWIAMEPFDYIPDGPTCAARSIGYVSGILEALA